MPPSTYPLPCDSEATEAVEQQLASVRREWIRRYDERKREVGLAPVLVPEDGAPRHVFETGAQAGADDDPHDDDTGDQGDAPSPARGALRADHVVFCRCGCGGVSDQSLRRAAQPRTRPATAAYRPYQSLDSVLLPRGTADRSLLDAALAEAKAARPDDQMVLKGGCGPERVRLLDHDEYPSCVRYGSAICYGGGLLATYGAGVYS